MTLKKKSTKQKTDINKQEKTLLFIIISISAGLLVGCVSYIFADESIVDISTDLFLYFTKNISDNKPLTIFTSLLSEHITYFFSTALFATSVFGKPAIYASAVIKSSGIGFLASNIYCNYALEGLEYCLLIYFPSMIVFLLFMLILMKSSLLFHDSIKQGSALITKTTLTNFTISALFLILSCITECVLIMSFSSFFSF